MSRLFEKNCKKLLTYCVLSDIIINCITIACIIALFFRRNAENRSENALIPPFCRDIAGSGKIKILPKVKASLKLELE